MLRHVGDNVIVGRSGVLRIKFVDAPEMLPSC